MATAVLADHLDAEAHAVYAAAVGMVVSVYLLDLAEAEVPLSEPLTVAAVLADLCDLAGCSAPEPVRLLIEGDAGWAGAVAAPGRGGGAGEASGLGASEAVAVGLG